MFAKIQIKGTIEVLTGMHIGGNNLYSAIGSVDSPVIKDIITGNPMIPGSSLKGKMRSLLSKLYNESVTDDYNEDDDKIRNLFGHSKEKNSMPSRLIFSDMVLSNWEELKSYGLNSKTEVKFENNINRITGIANPRQIERSVRGSKFDLEIIYEVNQNYDIEEDFKILSNGFKLLEYDYIGGNGSRGYGKIKFSDLKLETVIGNVDKNIIESCQNLLNEV